MKNFVFQKITIFFALAILFSACNQEKSAGGKKMTDAEKAIIEEETKVVERVDSIPQEFYVTSEKPGKIELITYTTNDYLVTKNKYEKNAYVYLPYGYSKKKKYKVLYLMHGIGGGEGEWGMKDDFSLIKRFMDNLIEKEIIEPFIIVTPNGRTCKNYHDTDFSNAQSFYRFGKELRNDLIPYMEKHYSVSKKRDDRAMAGLSMGGMQTINIGICECLDLISWFGAFSAAPTSYDARKVATTINSKKDLPINYFYNICGVSDGTALGSHQNAVKNITEYTAALVEDKNFCWQTVSGGHTFSVWYLGFFNFAQIFGK